MAAAKVTALQVILPIAGQRLARGGKRRLGAMTSYVNYETKLDTVTSGYDGVTCWVQARAGAMPRAGNDDMPAVVLTMQKLLLSGSDVFYALNEMRSDDMGATWSGPVEHPALARRQEPGGIEAVISGATPQWHAASGKLLLTGHCARYIGDALMPDPRPREATYAVYDEENRSWSRWESVELPEEEKFFSAGPGGGQRVDLPEGEILLPVYHQEPTDDSWKSCYRTSVLRCGFDGERLSYLEQGNELTVAEPRGLCEPSLTYFQGRYYMTLRNDVRGYVAFSDDGLNYEPPRAWAFDDGEELGSYNTQQHWVTHSDGLFLVYTRRGLNNDHVMRHRAPLLMAQVDTEQLRVIRETERIVVPERGARLGNFGTANMTPQESWIIAAEWMQPAGCEKYGSNNSVFAARILWEEPNLYAPS